MPPKKSKPKDENKEKESRQEAKASAADAGAGSIANGDIITIEFDAWTINSDGTEELFDTTNEEHAKAGNIHSEKARYEPIVIVVGDGRVIPGLDRSFVGAEVGKKAIVKIPPSEGAGERLPNMVEIFSVRELQKQNIDPEPGMRIQIKDRVGTITSMTSGRVRVDFNDPLAGKTLKYDYTVIKKAETPEERVLGIIDADFGQASEFRAKVTGDELELVLADMCKYNQVWYAVKFKVVSDLRKFIGAKNIRFIEEYVKKEEPKPEEPTPVEPEESEVIPSGEGK
jgi:FKBP-type peptidyl-prolyl cis-trans isomerase 2